MAQMPPEGARGSAAGAADMPSEDELREAYAAELRRISSADLILQTAASLINVGAYRLGLTGAEPAERDLEQVRDAIDGVRGLLPILERRGSAQQLRPLRDALSQLQLAYAREATQEGAQPGDADEREPAQEAAAAPGGAEATAAEAGEAAAAQQPGEDRRPGPAESSGRLWVPGQG